MLSPSRILKIDHLVMLNSFLNSVFSSKKWLYHYFDTMSQHFKINRTPHYFDILIQIELKSFNFWVDWRLDNPLNCKVVKKVWCAKTDAKIVLEGFLESEGLKSEDAEHQEASTSKDEMRVRWIRRGRLSNFVSRIIITLYGVITHNPRQTLVFSICPLS